MFFAVFKQYRVISPKIRSNIRSRYIVALFTTLFFGKQKKNLLFPPTSSRLVFLGGIKCETGLRQSKNIARRSRLFDPDKSTLLQRDKEKERKIALLAVWKSRVTQALS